jgi:hypothetical protein
VFVLKDEHAGEYGRVRLFIVDESELMSYFRKREVLERRESFFFLLFFFHLLGQRGDEERTGAVS